jgi:3-oxoacyl-[acyl-carrier protein] reductase
MKEIDAAGRRCEGIDCDVSSSESVAQMFTQVRERFGTLDILVNNAALVPASPADEEQRNRHYAYVTTPMPRQ